MKLSLAKGAFVVLAMATGIAACSSRTADAPSVSASGGEHTGAVGYELRLGRTTHINKASYTLTCPGGFSKSGTIDVSKLAELEGSIPNLPPGGPCSLTLTATSTNGNVTCSGSKGGLTVTCPGNRPHDENHFKVICTRNHQGREWGDNDWKENARTFQLGAELNFVCGTSDAGADAAPEAEAGPGPSPDAGPDADSCVPSNASCGTQTCAAAPDGCGGEVHCGPLNGACAAGLTCVAPGSCVACAVACPAGQTCGTFINPAGCPIPAINCGSCPSPQMTCNSGPGGAPPSCCLSTNATCPAGQMCGTAPDGCGGTISCGPLSGTCPPGLTCDASGQCVSCAATCPSGANCGTITNPAGCPVPTLHCGTCPTTNPNEVCGGGPNPMPNVCGCTPTPAATACGTQNCGTAPDGCGGVVLCGPLSGACPGGVTCLQGSCLVSCAVSCPAGDDCGTITNLAGCPNPTINCGTCPTSPNPNEVCGGGPNPRPNVCGCMPTPAATACANNACGNVPDGCGGTVACGTCPPNLCDPSVPTSSTLGCLAQQNKATTTDPTKVCSTCVVNNGCFDTFQQGGTCETVVGNANLLSGPLSDGKTCAQVFSPLTAPVSERAVCLDVLHTLFTSKCVAGLQVSSCLCGSIDIPTCVAGLAIPTGAAYDEYACDFNSPKTSVIDAISTNFVVQTFGAGQANALVQCAALFGCDCF